MNYASWENALRYHTTVTKLEDVFSAVGLRFLINVNHDSRAIVISVL